jgi:2-phosphoglycolate phosphatase
MIKAVLFDLDGTFADTAPDLSYAINVMREARGQAPLPLAATRPVTSHGARGLLGVGFGVAPEDAQYPALRDEFLAIYTDNLCRHSRVFPGTDRLLDQLETRGLKWGIVTNKAERLARPLMDQLGYTHRAACIIGGDTTSRSKPHPEPLLAASRALSLEVTECIYVGDDERDVQAAHAAGMKAIVVRYGYLNGTLPETWGAEVIVDRPEDILDHL